jgi:glycine/D-amino acid oxidase-like deaminating enzyme/nitrite reductase/ring-hydroxylating ferredoxin subunit
MLKLRFCRHANRSLSLIKQTDLTPTSPSPWGDIMKSTTTNEVHTTSSLWSEKITHRSRPGLKASISADVCVVGAGIAGVTTAYLLSKSGKKVVVLDDGDIGGGQTEVTTAHLTSVPDRRYKDLEKMHGVALTPLIYASHAAAINQIERNVESEGIDCDFTRLPAYLFLDTDHSTALLDEEYEAARRTGMSVTRLSQMPSENFLAGPCLRFGGQGQFHPLKYLLRLAEAIEQNGGKIYGRTHVKSVEGGDLVHVLVDKDYVVTADHAVVATNTPINDWVTIHTKQAPYLSYVIGIEIPKDTLPQALYWDTADPFHYVRLQSGGENAMNDILILGGEDHKTGQADDGDERFARLEQWIRLRVANLGDVVYQWSGQVMESADGLAFIGRNPGDSPNVYIATGDSGVGMTHGTIAGKLITDLIHGRDNPWAKLYDPSRKPLGALGQFARENLNVATQYTAWLTPGDVSSVEEIKNGEGAVLRRGLSKVAAYRDKHGKLTEMSAVCPHLQCIVAWNKVESTWDCPCHGSRFDPHGKVLNGPANVNLPLMEPKES